jgi:hypothetical protein
MISWIKILLFNNLILHKYLLSLHFLGFEYMNQTTVSAIASNELSVQLTQKEQKFKRVKLWFNVIFALCFLVFALGLVWMNVMAIASSFITAMMFGMAYLGVIMIFEEDINEIKTKLEKTVSVSI